MWVWDSDGFGPTGDSFELVDKCWRFRSDGHTDELSGVNEGPTMTWWYKV